MRYSNACLRIFVVILQDLHCLQRSYHNFDHWGIRLYHHTNFNISVVRPAYVTHDFICNDVIISIAKWHGWPRRMSTFWPGYSSIVYMQFWNHTGSEV